jgi:hypothetical protein
MANTKTKNKKEQEISVSKYMKKLKHLYTAGNVKFWRRQYGSA